jgi:hypothetical protein
MTIESNDKIVDALVLAIKNDLKRGVNKDRLMSSLSRVVDNDIYNSIKDRI